MKTLCLFFAVWDAGWFFGDGALWMFAGHHWWSLASALFCGALAYPMYRMGRDW